MKEHQWVLIGLACVLYFFLGMFIASTTDAVAMFWQQAYFSQHAERRALVDEILRQRKELDYLHMERPISSNR